MLWVAQSAVYHVGTSLLQVHQLLGLVHAEPPTEVLSEGGVLFRSPTAKDVIGSSVLHLSGEHGTSSTRHRSWLSPPHLLGLLPPLWEDVLYALTPLSVAAV